jgi:hypothetical protein
MSNRKITQLAINNSPTLLDVFPIVNNGVTKQISLTGLTAFIGPYIDTTNPMLTGGTYDNNTGTATFTNSTGGTFYVSGFTNSFLTGGTYDNNTGTATFKDSVGGSFEISGFTTNVKHWEENQNKVLKSEETLVISGDYVLVNTDLELQQDSQITIGSLTFNKYAQLYIGGNLLLLNSNIVNNGSISVGGATIFSGNSTITGTGIIN